jgi:ribosomal protein L32
VIRPATYPSSVPEETIRLLALIAAAALGILATLGILRRQRRDADDAVRENPYATATEGMKRCPSCGAANQAHDRTCNSCGKRLPG